MGVDIINGLLVFPTSLKHLFSIISYSDIIQINCIVLNTHAR